MHPYAIMLAVAGFALLPGATEPGPKIGKLAPAFTLTDAQGKRHSLSEYKGKAVVIEWVNIACPAAQWKYESGVVPRLQKKYTAKGVVWLSMIVTEKQQDEWGENLVSEERAKSMANALVEKYGASPTATLIDLGGAVAATYDTRTSMHLFVVDRRGILVYDGALDSRATPYGKPEDSRDYVATALDAALANKPVTTPKTMPAGCHMVGNHLTEPSSDVPPGTVIR